MNPQNRRLLVRLGLLLLIASLWLLWSESRDEPTLGVTPDSGTEPTLDTAMDSDMESPDLGNADGKKRVSGQVIDARGQGVPGATVEVRLVADEKEAQDPKPRAKEFPPIHTTTSGQDGAFQFPPLPMADNFWITAVGPQKRRAGQLRLPAFRDLSLITIPVYEGFTLRGIVVDSNKKPLANLSVGVADVKLWDPKRPRDLANGSMQTITDKDGKFVIHGLQVGSVFLRIQGEDWINKSSIPISIEAGSQSPLVIEATKSLAIEGIVLNGDRMPIPGAQVLIKPENGGWRKNRYGGMTTTAKDGRFRVGGLSNGNYSIYVQGRTNFPTDKQKRKSPYLAKSQRFVKKGVNPGAGLIEIVLDN